MLAVAAALVVIVAGAGLLLYHFRDKTHGHITGAQITSARIDGQQVEALAAGRSGPRALLVFAHGVDGDHRTPTENRVVPFTQKLIDDGWVVAASDAGGAAWGSSKSQRDYLDLIGWARQHYRISGVVLLGESMGGVASLDLAASGKVADLRGWVGVSPVTNLPAMTDFTESIDQALTPAEQRQVDPLALSPDALADVPMSIYASPTDTVAPPAVEVTPFVQRMAPTVQIAVRSCAGGHVAPGCYDPAAVESLVR